METQISVFKHKINIVCHKKAELIEESFCAMPLAYRILPMRIS
ncbi:hypothetical protein [Prevotella corporis]|nr:hypothetical protein [Prevotella corporis]